MIGHYNKDRKRGVQLPFSKLNDEKVIAARIKYCNGEKRIIELAREYHVHYKTIHQIVKGYTWKHIPMPKITEQIQPGECNIKIENKRGVLPKTALLTDKQANSIRYLFSVRRLPIKIIAESYRVRYDVIYKIVYGYTYNEAGGPIAKKNYARGELAIC
jgi:hypothetical protein